MNPKLVTTILQKAALVFFGLVLAFALLEGGMRLGAFVLGSIQNYENSQSTKETNAYRILCLGESTTSGQYPRHLEKILNEQNRGLRFSVIDKGRVGTNTAVILNQVESYLNEYHPNMVVAMMGINDGGKHCPFEAPTISKGMLLLRQLRVYKLTRFLYLHLLTQAQAMGFCKIVADAQNSWKKEMALNPQDDHSYIEMGRIYREQGYFSQAEVIIMKAIELNPNNDKAWLELGRSYRELNNISKAEDSFRKAVVLDPKNDKSWVELGQIYSKKGEASQAEISFKNALELNPKNDNAYIELGWLYREREEFFEAEKFFNKAVAINPENDNNHMELGGLHRDRGELHLAEISFKKASGLNPKNDIARSELGGIYRRQGEFVKAEILLKEALQIDPQNHRTAGALLSLYEEQGMPELAKQYAETTTRLERDCIFSATASNYRKLKEILDRKGIVLVCVQYPMRSVALLKKLFDEEKTVFFVDNDVVFREALRNSPYNEYFRDMFAGDFGHCTPKGNKLLAQSIADVILEKVFAVRRTADQKQGLKRDAIL